MRECGGSGNFYLNNCRSRASKPEGRSRLGSRVMSGIVMKLNRSFFCVQNLFLLLGIVFSLYNGALLLMFLVPSDYTFVRSADWIVDYVISCVGGLGFILLAIRELSDIAGGLNGGKVVKG